jgi:hypothetical protein
MVKGFLQMMAAALVLGYGASSVTAQQSDLRGSLTSVEPLIERYDADRASLSHVYDAPLSETREQRFKALYTEGRHLAKG